MSKRRERAAAFKFEEKKYAKQSNRVESFVWLDVGSGVDERNTRAGRHRAATVRALPASDADAASSPSATRAAR
jgi:hypothetical protein